MAEERAARMEARMDKFDQRLEATRKLVEGGMKFVIKTFREHAVAMKDFDRRLKDITELQKKTDVKLDRLINFWTKRNPNGHKH